MDVFVELGAVQVIDLRLLQENRRLGLVRRMVRENNLRLMKRNRSGLDLSSGCILGDMAEFDRRDGAVNLVRRGHVERDRPSMLDRRVFEDLDADGVLHRVDHLAVYARLRLGRRHKVSEILDEFRVRSDRLNSFRRPNQRLYGFCMRRNSRRGEELLGRSDRSLSRHGLCKITWGLSVFHRSLYRRVERVY